MNKVAGYRNMLGYTQLDMANIMNISLQAYWQKENGKISFSDAEKKQFKNMLLPHFPSITIDEIFFE